MKYRVDAWIELDTKTNKVVIEAAGKRIVFFPGSKIAEHWVEVSVNDRHVSGPFSYAKDICRFLAHTLHGRKQIKKIQRNVTEQFLQDEVKHG